MSFEVNPSGNPSSLGRWEKGKEARWSFQAEKTRNYKKLVSVKHRGY